MHPRLSDADRAALRRDGRFVGGLLALVVLCLSCLFDVLLLVLSLCGVLTEKAFSLPDLGLGYTAYTLLYGGVYIICMGLPVWLCCRLCGRSLRMLVSARPVRATQTTLTVTTGLGACMLASMVCSMLETFLQNHGLAQPTPPVLLDGSLPCFLAAVFTWALLPAVLEETVFRVCILGSLRKYGDWFAVLISAVLFGCVHGGISQSLFAFLIGCVLGYITVSTGNVWISVGIHFANNALSVCLQQHTLPLSAEQAATATAAVLMSVITVGALSVLCSKRLGVSLFRRVSSMNRSAGDCLRVLFTSPLLLIGVMLMVMRMILILI